MSTGPSTDLIAGPATGLAVRAVTELALHSLRAAVHQVGVQECPRGSNSGPDVDAYLHSVGLGPGHAWCAAMVSWCVQQGAQELGITPRFKYSGSALGLWHDNPDLRHHDLDAVNDLPCVVVWDHGHGLGHTGIACGYDPDRRMLQVVSGNTNSTGARDGFEVCAQDRPIADPRLVGFVRIE